MHVGGADPSVRQIRLPQNRRPLEGPRQELRRYTVGLSCLYRGAAAILTAGLPVRPPVESGLPQACTGARDCILKLGLSSEKSAVLLCPLRACHPIFENVSIGDICLHLCSKCRIL